MLEMAKMINKCPTIQNSNAFSLDGTEDSLNGLGKSNYQAETPEI